MKTFFVDHYIISVFTLKTFFGDHTLKTFFGDALWQYVMRIKSGPLN